MPPDGVDIWYYKSDKIDLTEFIILKHHIETSYFIYKYTLCYVIITNEPLDRFDSNFGWAIL